MQRQLQKIKIFPIEAFVNTNSLEKAINDYVIEAFNKEKNYPKIEVTSKYVAVIHEALVEVIG